MTLDQAAAICSQSKRTLERYLQEKKLPEPDIRGKRGKPHRWKWSTIRPKLMDHWRPELPEQFPGSSPL